MADLHDSTQPPGAIVATHEDDESLEEGQVRRNDGVVLNPACRNRWYVLATVAGEQEKEEDWGVGKSTTARNRRFWNGWMCQDMSEKERKALSEKLQLGVEELIPASEKEIALLEKHFAEAFPKVAADQRLPNPRADIDMSKLHFKRDLAIGKFYFPQRATFSYTHFTKRASFNTALFAGPANFNAVHFAGHARFDNANFFGHALFNSSYFAKAVCFSDGAFQAKIDFSETTFATVAPEFFHRQMHQDTSFSDAAKLWPDVTEDNAEDGKRAYTRLRQVAAEIYDPDLEHFFLRQEMRCKARIEWDKRAWFHWLFFVLYRGIADSGISVARPFWLLAFIWAFGFACFAGHFDSGVLPDLPADIQDSRYRTAAGVSFGNLFGFLGINRLYFADLLRNHIPDGLQLVSGMQTVAGVILLFFFGLGLRNRFRLK